jgi:hypothetical protein
MMRRFVLGVAVAIFFILPNSKGFAAPRVPAQSSPIPITECGDIAQPGNYALQNDLVLAVYSNPPVGGDCLTVSASHVNINMQGFAITASCPNFPCPPFFYGPVGAAGIHILNGANHVSISNGTVEDFVDGVVGESDFLSASDLVLEADVGLTLNEVSYSTFANITYFAGDPREHAFNGPILSLNGGGYNAFVSVKGNVANDSGYSTGIEVANSNNNLIFGATMQNDSVCGGGADILLTGGSSFNAVLESSLFDDCGGGIEVDTGGAHNLIFGNSVTILSADGGFAMVDQNPECGSDLWFKNSFSNESTPGEISASPSSCIH